MKDALISGYNNVIGGWFSTISVFSIIVVKGSPLGPMACLSIVFGLTMVPGMGFISWSKTNPMRKHLVSLMTFMPLLY